MKRRQFLESIVASAFAIGPRPPFASGLRLSNALLEQGPKSKNVAPEFFYRPANAWAGDFIPYCKDGRFHLFFLLDWRDKVTHDEGTP
jgi:hypothetical protein